MTTAPEAKGIYVTQELTESEPMIEEQSTSRLCHVNRKEYSVIFIFDCDVVLDKCDIIGKPAPLPKYANGADLLLKYDAAASQPQPDIINGFNKINCLGLNDLGFSDLGLSNLSLYDKTKHSALEMMCSDDFSLKLVLVLQVVLSFHNYICLSDGKNVVSALVPSNLVDESRCYEVDILSSGFKDELVHSTMPQVGTIVKLTNYTLKEFQRHKFFIIIHFDVVLENHVIIGRPVQLPTNPSWTYHPIEHFFLTCPPVKLTQGAIDNILSGNFSSDKGFKPVLQVFCLRNNIIFLSDGCYRFYLICDGDLRGRFKNRSRFSVIKLTDYYLLENSKNHK
ncbi:hypothetical protein QL285_027253 [Trifolium repens]|nr:hypothetical protein QL285_027253 [Trifolium repens]